jgi:hypothetical protein
MDGKTLIAELAAEDAYSSSAAHGAIAPQLPEALRKEKRRNFFPRPSGSGVC